MINPVFVKVPESWGVKRDTIQPKENYKEDSFGKTFDETYDYDTLFSGVIRLENMVVFVAPPFLNLERFIIQNVSITDGKNEITLKFITLDRCSVAIAPVDPKAKTLYLTYGDDTTEVPIEDNLCGDFASKSVLFTMFKNDSLESVDHWIKYHNKVCGIEGFILFNNNSDTYTSQEAQDYLKSDDYNVVIVDWPMRWGVVGPPWDSDFCKIVGLQYLKYKFCYNAKLLLNLDVDEYFCSEYSTDDITTAMSIQGVDSINMESKNISRYSKVENPKISDYYWWNEEQVDLNKMTKWITLPTKSRDYCWTTHFVFSPNREDTDDAYYAHLSCLVGEHHVKNATEVARKRFIVLDNNKENTLLKNNFQKMEQLL